MKWLTAVVALLLVSAAWRCGGSAQGDSGSAAKDEAFVRISSSDGRSKKSAKYTEDAQALALRDSLWDALLKAQDAPRMPLTASAIKQLRAAAHIEVESRPALSGVIAKWKQPVEATHLLLPVGPGWQGGSADILFGNPGYETGNAYISSLDGAALRSLLTALKLPVPPDLPKDDE